MVPRLSRVAGIVSFTILWTLTPASSAESDRPLKVGAAAPAWTNLPAADGKSYSLADFKDYPIVVVTFTCNSCPFSVAYEDRFITFAKAFESKGVKFVAICVNNEDSDRLEAMKARAEEKKFPFPYLADQSQKIGHQYGARTTPHLFVLDKDRKVAYIGAFDNAARPDKVSKRHVEDAVHALLAGRKPAVEQTRAIGCSIRYE